MYNVYTSGCWLLGLDRATALECKEQDALCYLVRVA